MIGLLVLKHLKLLCEEFVLKLEHLEFLIISRISIKISTQHDLAIRLVVKVLDNLLDLGV